MKFQVLLMLRDVRSGAVRDRLRHVGARLGDGRVDRSASHDIASNPAATAKPCPLDSHCALLDLATRASLVSSLKKTGKGCFSSRPRAARVAGRDPRHRRTWRRGARRARPPSADPVCRSRGTQEESRLPTEARPAGPTRRGGFRATRAATAKVPRPFARAWHAGRPEERRSRRGGPLREPRGRGAGRPRATAGACDTGGDLRPAPTRRCPKPPSIGSSGRRADRRRSWRSADILAGSVPRGRPIRSPRRDPSPAVPAAAGSAACGREARREGGGLRPGHEGLEPYRPPPGGCGHRHSGQREGGRGERTRPRCGRKSSRRSGGEASRVWFESAGSLLGAASLSSVFDRGSALYSALSGVFVGPGPQVLPAYVYFLRRMPRDATSLLPRRSNQIVAHGAVGNSRAPRSSPASRGGPSRRTTARRPGPRPCARSSRAACCSAPVQGGDSGGDRRQAAVQASLRPPRRARWPRTG